MEEEIDLRVYIEVILKRWQWVVGLSVLAAVVAFVISSFLPPVYEAEAKVIALKSSTNISFEPSILSDVIQPRDNTTTLANLVKSNDIAALVLEKLPQDLPGPELDVFTIQDNILVGSSAQIISIRVQHRDPVIATQVANIWAETYVEYVNNLFSDQGGQLILEIEEQAQEASTKYQTAQKNLETFLGDNEIVILQKNVASLKLNLNTQYEQLNNAYAELTRIEDWLEDARTLQDQLGATTTSSNAALGDTIALTQLRMRTTQSVALQKTEVISTADEFSISAPAPVVSPVELQFALSAPDVNTLSPEDAANMIDVVEAHKLRVQADIERLATELLQADMNSRVASASDTSIQGPSGLLNQILVLEAALEAQRAQERELTETRDLAWQNYQAVQRKLAEVELDSKITDSEVRIAAHALPSQDSVSPRRLLNTVIAGTLGFFLSITLIFVMEYWQQDEEQARPLDQPVSSTP